MTIVAPRSLLSRAPAGPDPWYLAAVCVGALLIIVASINQPYNQNELQQMAPYGSGSVEEITAGTRQPPLDPLLGALVQHLLGEGQLRQRLVPALCGIGTLVLVAAVLCRLGTGWAGAFGVWVLATSPLMVRYSAYTRPYALPLFLMMLLVYAAQRWLEDGQRRWLLLVGLAAAALPLARVPEPTAFLLTLAVVLTWWAWRGRLAWGQVWPLVAVSLGALATVGFWMSTSLATQSSGLVDPSPAGVADRFVPATVEVATFLLPLLATWFPWWPVTVALVLTALVLPTSRRLLLSWWLWLPLLAGPVAFALSLYFLTLDPFDSDIRPYRARYAYFLLPAYAMVAVAVAMAWQGIDRKVRALRVAVGALLVAALVGQLPATARVLITNESPDYGQAAEVIERLPDDAIVLYDTPNEAGGWRQPFSAKPRYLAAVPFATAVNGIPHRARLVPETGPVYLLILDSECAQSVVCDDPPRRWNKDVEGFELAERFDRFRLYAPTDGQSGPEGTIRALRSLGRSFGPDLGYIERFAAAWLLQHEGRAGEGERLIQRMYDRATPGAVERIRGAEARRNLDPFAG
ncbi:hypothetical protein BH24ACT12_BH24ACT12_02110 [soil metagenome]